MAPVLNSTVRVLDLRDADEALALCDRNPVVNLFVSSRLHALRQQQRRGGEVWGWPATGPLRSLCWSGANLVPVEATPDAIVAFAARARRQGRQCSSIVGPAEQVLPLWARLEPAWGPAREVRGDQPLLALDGDPLVDPDPAVRLSRADELNLVVPACVAMFTEEVGYSPTASDGGALYRSQVAGLVHSARSLVRIDADTRGPRVVFKAELGSVTPLAAQVQGVWVNPVDRGRGLAAPGMAAVVNHVRKHLAPVVSLYVNSYNTRALAAYRRVGFTPVGTYATILF